MLHWQRQGTGPHVVLVHGFLSSGVIFDSLAQHLRRDFTVTTVDLPGHAGSYDVPVPDSVASLSQMVARTIYDSGIHDCALLGHSLGAMIALELSLQGEPLLNKVVLYGGCPDGYLPARFESTEATIEKIRSRGITSVAADIAAEWFVHGNADPLYPQAVAVGKYSNEEAAIAHLQTWDSWFARERLAHVNTPALIVCGDSDRSTHPELSIEMWRKIPQARLFIAPNAGHIVHLEYTNAFNGLVKAFLIS